MASALQSASYFPKAEASFGKPKPKERVNAEGVDTIKQARNSFQAQMIVKVNVHERWRRLARYGIS